MENNALADPEFAPPSRTTDALGDSVSAADDPEFASPNRQQSNLVVPQVQGDRANRVLDLSRKTNISPGFVDKNMDSVEQALKMPNFETLVESHPVTSEWLSNPENLARSIDDIDNLKQHEAVLSQGEPPGIFKRAFRYVTEASFAEQVAQAQNLMAIAKATGRQPGEVTPSEVIPFGREKGLATQPTGGELANAAMIAAITAGGGEAMAAGKLLAYAGRTALTIGAFGGLNKLIPTDTFVPTDANDATKTAIEIADFIAKGAVAGGLAGAVRPVGEFIKAKFAEKGIADKLPEAEQGEIINGAIDKLALSGEPPAPTPAERTLSALDSLAKQNKLAKLPNGTYADYVQHAADEYGKGSILVKSDDFNAYFQSKGIDPEAEIRKLGAEPSESGADLEIPTGRFVATYANTEHIRGLARYARFGPETGPGEAGVILPGMEGEEGRKAPPNADLEARKAIESKEPVAIDDITATKDPVKTFLDISKKQQEFTGDIEKDRYSLEAANEVDKLHAFQLLGKIEGAPEDYEAIYYHLEDSAEPISEMQRAIYDKEIAPLREGAREAFYDLKDKEVPVEPDDYSGRIVADRGGLIERMRAGFNSLSQGGILRQSYGALKRRIMWAIEYGEGNRKVVSIKAGDVVEWKDGIPTYLGKQKLPTMPKISEFFDKHVMEKLEALAKNLGIKHERVLKGKGLGGNRLGVSFQGTNLVKTKFATPEAVLLHEIGHQLDLRYHLQDEFLGGKPKANIILDKMIGKAEREGRTADAARLREQEMLNAEFRRLVDLKYENEETSEYFKKYVRKSPEKIAGMFEAYLQAPQRFQEVAPNLYKKFVDYVGGREELKPILDIKPSMVYGKKTIGGPQEPMTFTDKDGKKWDIKTALTKEIEANTSIIYHKNALITNLLNYVNLRKVQRSVEYLENLKNSPQFLEFAVKINTPEYDRLLQEAPNEFRESTVPQLRGYLFPNRVANAFDDFYKSRTTDGLASAYSKINRFMRNAIFFNPLIHVPNILNHWAVDRGISGLSPMTYPGLTRSSLRAWRAVTTLNQDYVDVMNAGGHLLFAKTKLGNLSEMLLKSAGMELNADKSLLGKIGKELGCANPANLVKAVYKFSSEVTWGTNDIATLQRIFERMEHGLTMVDAVAETAKHIPNYRIPSEVLNSRSIAQLMRGEGNFPLTMFGAYHYGALKSYGEMLKGLREGLTGKASPSQVAETVDKIAALAIGTYFVYPLLDQIVQAVTGNPYASIRRAGASTFLHNVGKLETARESRQGITSVDVARFVQSVATPAVGLKAGMEFYMGRDMYNGRPINIGQKIAGSISPLDYGRRIYEGDMTPAQFGWGLLGVKTPKRRPR